MIQKATNDSLFCFGKLLMEHFWQNRIFQKFTSFFGMIFINEVKGVTFFWIIMMIKTLKKTRMK
ncbi:hypothetical protein CEE91_03035 [Lactobacillus crispatus]|nr:hypothetical protein CEE93_11120 [Lactobacillus crispatus]TDM93228.1 hypothetical protein CEE91_03035 [Lactobacillus crispatus]